MTPPSRDWHLDESSLEAYVDGSGTLALAASAEAHLLSCHTCRAEVAVRVGSRRLTDVRDRLDDALDTSSRPWTERLLLVSGMPESDARVLLASPALRRAWWLALVLVLALGVLHSWQDPRDSDAVLLLAPLLPALATAVSYSPQLDPSLPITAATPYPAMRLLMLRSGAVAGSAIALLSVANAALPYPLHRGLLWLLPAVALSASVVALSRWIDSGVAAGMCAAGWLAVVATIGRTSADHLAVYGGRGQLLSAALLVVAAAVLFVQRHRLDPGGTS